MIPAGIEVSICLCSVEEARVSGQNKQTYTTRPDGGFKPTTFLMQANSAATLLMCFSISHL